MTTANRILALLSALLLSACTGIPENIEPVENFNAERYLGTWYEIARLDHRFERGLRNVTATYTQQDDGSIAVENRGYSTRKQKWSSATGSAKFVGSSTTGHLKVSFFGPFYGSYVVYNLDKSDYQYAFVTGNTRKYLWLLSRTPTVEPTLIEQFKEEAAQLGYDLSKLIIVDQSAQ